MNIKMGNVVYMIVNETAYTINGQNKIYTGHITAFNNGLGSILQSKHLFLSAFCTLIVFQAINIVIFVTVMSSTFL